MALICTPTLHLTSISVTKNRCFKICYENNNPEVDSSNPIMKADRSTLLHLASAQHLGFFSGSDKSERLSQTYITSC